MIIVVSSVTAAGVLVLALLAAAGRLAAQGRELVDPDAPGLPLVAARGTRFGEATALSRGRLRIVPPTPAVPAQGAPVEDVPVTTAAAAPAPAEHGRTTTAA